MAATLRLWQTAPDVHASVYGLCRQVADRSQNAGGGQRQADLNRARLKWQRRAARLATRHGFRIPKVFACK
jgi:hypothetical protein